MSDAAVLQVRDLSKTLLGQAALRSVSLDADAGQVHALIGHNASGKSTLIKILAGYHHPDDHQSGRVVVGMVVAGEDLKFGRADEPHRSELRFIHQDLGLVEDLTVLENLHLGPKYDTGRGQHATSSTGSTAASAGSPLCTSTVTIDELRI
jgi:ribose transport system ATP-binding protein